MTLARNQVVLGRGHTPMPSGVRSRAVGEGSKSTFRTSTFAHNVCPPSPFTPRAETSPPKYFSDIGRIRTRLLWEERSHENPGQHSGSGI